MIGELSYEEYQNIINTLENSNTNLKKIVNHYENHQLVKSNSIKIESFINALDNYLRYLKGTYEINIISDKALEKLKKSNE